MYLWIHPKIYPHFAQVKTFPPPRARDVRIPKVQILHVQILQVGDCMGLMFQAGLSWGCFTNLFSGWCRAVGLNWLYGAVYYFRKFLEVSENRLPALLPKNFRLGFLMNLSESCLVCFTTPQNHPSTHIKAFKRSASHPYCSRIAFSWHGNREA